MTASSSSASLSAPPPGAAPVRISAGIHLFIPAALVQWPELAAQREHEAAILFIDVAGFTRLSESLSARGPEGAEVLDRTISAYFDSIMDVVDRYGGRPLKISGDALTILFLADGGSLEWAALRAVACAARLADTSGASPESSLAHKIGVGAGMLYTGIVGRSGGRQELVFGGPALDSAVAAEHCAVAGDVWLAPEVAKAVGLGAAPSPLRLRPEDRRSLPLLNLGTPAADTFPAAAFDRWLTLIPAAVRQHAARASVEYLCRHQSITVIFAGAPGLSMDGPDAIDRVNSHYSAMAEVVGRHGGFLSEFEAGDKGSKLICLFGAPSMLEDPSRQAIRCARAMQETARDMKMVPDQRIGVTTGHLYVGRIGCRSIFKYSALGDRMNLAARLMSAAKPWEVLSASRTVERTRPYALWGERRTIQVKGKDEPITIHALIGLRKVHNASRRGQGVVGRDAEWDQVSRQLAGLQRNAGGVVDVVGAAGMGKTRFAGALWRMATESHSVDCHLWRGPTTERRSGPLAPWARLLAEIVGTAGLAEPQERAAALEGWLAGLSPDQRPGATLLAPLLDVAMAPDPAVAGLDADRRLLLQREALVDAVISGSPALGPRALIIDEAERIDVPSAQVLADLMPVFDTLPLLVIALRRPHEGDADPLAAAAAGASYTQVKLSPLTRETADALVRDRLGATSLDGELSSLIFGRSQGVPLMLEAWVDTLKGAERIALVEGTAFLVGEGAVELPDRFEALVLTRMERLPPEAQTTLRLASIMEVPFTPAEVAELHHGRLAAVEVAHHLSQGAEIGLIYYERDRSPYMYFSRREVRDAVHNTLPFQLRRRLHGARVRQLQSQQGAEDTSDGVLLLASHHRYVDDPVAQLRYFRRAMDVCAERYAQREAAGWARAALDIARESGSPADRLACLDGLQRALTLLGEIENRGAVLAQLYDEARAQGDVAGMVESLTMQARAQQRQGKVDAALALIEQAKEVAEEGASPSMVALCLTTKATVNTEAGRLQEGLEDAREALRRLPPEDTARRAMVLSNMGMALNALGRSAEAYPVLREALAASEAAGNLWHTALLEGNLGIELWGMGYPEEGHARLLKALELKRRIGDRREQAMGMLNMGFSHLRLGLPQKAREDTEEAHRIFRRLGYRRGSLYCLLNLGENELYCGAPSTCESLLDRLDAELEASPHSGIRLESLLNRGELCLLREEPAAAGRLFREALEISRAHSIGVMEVRALEGLGYATFRSGDASGGRAWLEEAAQRLEALPEEGHFPQRLWWRAAEVTGADGDPAAAQTYAAKARAQLDEELGKLHEPATRERVIAAFAWNREIMAAGPPAPVRAAAPPAAIDGPSAAPSA